MSTAFPAGMTLARLLQWTSPILPVGAYSYSQGLESAVASGLVHDEASALAWIAALLEGPIGSAEAPYVAGFALAWVSEDSPRLSALNLQYLASRESAELHAETLQMGWSLLRLIAHLAAAPGADTPARARWVHLQDQLDWLSRAGPLSYALTWSGLASSSGVAPPALLIAWLWGWLENQVMAAMKSLPLGQNAGQLMLFQLGERLDALAVKAVALAGARVRPWDPLAAALSEDCLTGWPDGNLAPGYGIACAQHETQYSRLFRS